MDNLEKYISERKKKSKEFADGVEEGYKNFKIGYLLKQTRKSAGITQEELASRLNTKKSAISRIERHAEDIKLSTIQNYLGALNKTLRLSIH